MSAIYWIAHADPPHLAIVARPRGEDSLGEDLTYLKRGGIDVLVSLLPDLEADLLGLHFEGQLADQLGMEFISYPIPDRETPADSVSFRQLITRLTGAIRSGRRVGVHCRASIGRSTVVTAAVLVELGIPPKDALAVIQTARGYLVPDTLEQREWILRLQATGTTQQ
jgi:protein-tyrosine phosphatase